MFIVDSRARKQPELPGKAQIELGLEVGRGRTVREEERGTRSQEVRSGPGDQETTCPKWSRLYRDQRSWEKGKPRSFPGLDS